MNTLMFFILGVIIGDMLSGKNNKSSHRCVSVPPAQFKPPVRPPKQT